MLLCNNLFCSTYRLIADVFSSSVLSPSSIPLCPAIGFLPPHSAKPRPSCLQPIVIRTVLRLHPLRWLPGHGSVCICRRRLQQRRPRQQYQQQQHHHQRHGAGIGHRWGHPFFHLHRPSGRQCHAVCQIQLLRALRESGRAGRRHAGGLHEPADGRPKHRPPRRRHSQR